MVPLLSPARLSRNAPLWTCRANAGGRFAAVCEEPQTCADRVTALARIPAKTLGRREVSHASRKFRTFPVGAGQRARQGATARRRPRLCARARRQRTAPGRTALPVSGRRPAGWADVRETPFHRRRIPATTRRYRATVTVTVTVTDTGAKSAVQNSKPSSVCRSRPSAQSHSLWKFRSLAQRVADRPEGPGRGRA